MTKWIELVVISVLLFSVAFTLKKPDNRSLGFHAIANTVKKSHPNFVSVSFGDKFELLGATAVKAEDGLTIELAWENVRPKAILYALALHFLDRQGNIQLQLDRPMGDTTLLGKGGSAWIDRIQISDLKSRKLVSAAIGIYSLRDVKLLQVNKGTRDWDGRRLIMPLTSIHVIGSSKAAEVIAKTDLSYGNVSFGEMFILLGAQIIKKGDGLQLRFVWRSAGVQELSYFNAVHLLDSKGNVLATMDYPQDRGRATVKAGTLWLDEIDIPESRLKNVVSIGLGIYSYPGIQLLTVDKGVRDWGGKRLLIPLLTGQ